MSREWWKQKIFDLEMENAWLKADLEELRREKHTLRRNIDEINIAFHKDVADLKMELDELREHDAATMHDFADLFGVERHHCTAWGDLYCRAAKLKAELAQVKEREQRLWELLREAVQCFCVTQKPADYPVDSWINKALTELRRPEEAGPIPEPKEPA